MEFDNFKNEIIKGFSEVITNIDWANIITNIFKVVIVIILVKIGISVGNRIIDEVINTNKIKNITNVEKLNININFNEKRYDTLRTILKSVYKYILLFVGIVSILSNFIKVESLLAVAGVGGVAIGFGAQSLVEDVVTGFFIFLEDKFSLGEYITVNSFGGIVEDISLRSVKIRDFSGDLHILHNRTISEVTNHSRGNIRAMVDIPVSYEEDIQRCIDVLRDLCATISKENEVVVEGPEVLGVQKLDDSSVNIRIVAKTLPMEQWGVERMIRKLVKEEFDKQNIEIPYAKMVIYNK
ncbi:MAG: mechanosensitive ion channel family protein [Eubacteriaceae bacterium]